MTYTFTLVPKAQVRQRIHNSVRWEPVEVILRTTLHQRLDIFYERIGVDFRIVKSEIRVGLDCAEPSGLSVPDSIGEVVRTSLSQYGHVQHFAESR